MRPQTAASIKLKNNRTIEGRTVKSSYSTSSVITGRKKRKKGTKVNDIEIVVQVDENNEALFENIPKAVYNIESLENPFFQKSQREVNLENKKSNSGTCKVYLQVERQLTSCTSLYFLKTKENSEDFDEKSQEPEQYFEDLQVRAWLLEKQQKRYGESEDSDDGDETDYEEEFYFDKEAK